MSSESTKTNQVVNKKKQQGTKNRMKMKLSQASSTKKDPIEIDCLDAQSVAFRVATGGEQIVVVDGESKKIRRWRMKDKEEVGIAMDAGSDVRNISVSQDGKTVVGVSTDGRVRAWNAESQIEFKELVDSQKEGYLAHYALDVSRNATKIASATPYNTVSVWFFTTKRWQLRHIIEHQEPNVAIKFSPNGCLIAVATRHFVRIYHIDDRDVGLIAELRIEVDSLYNQALSWVSDSKQLFILSNSKIHRIDTYTREALSEISLSENSKQGRIVLSSNDRLIVAFDGSSISFWDTATCNKIGSDIINQDTIQSIAISANYDLAIAGQTKITVQNLRDILHGSCFDDISDILRSKVEPTLKVTTEFLPKQDERASAKEEITELRKTVEELRTQAQKIDNLNETIKSLRKVNVRLVEERAELKTTIEELRAQSQEIDSLNETVTSLRAEKAHSDDERAELKKTIEAMRLQAPEIDSLNETIMSLRAEIIHSDGTRADLEKTVEGLRARFADSQDTAKQIDSLNQTIKSLRVGKAGSNEEITNLEKTVEELRVQVKQMDRLNETITSLHAENTTSSEKMSDFEKTIQQQRDKLTETQHKANDIIQQLRAELVEFQQKAGRLTAILRQTMPAVE